MRSYDEDARVTRGAFSATADPMAAPMGDGLK